MNRLICVTFLLLFTFQNSISAQKKSSEKLKPIAFQIGKWLAADIQKSKDGRKLQFGYELQWFDHNKTIAKMTITGIFDDGEIRIFWEGFKNWNAEENRIVYSGFSKDGRIAQGHIEIESNKVLKTLYSGNGPGGKKVFIEDIATIIDTNHYTTVTRIRMDGQTAWQTVNTDRWVRIDNQRFNDNLKF